MPAANAGGGIARKGTTTEVKTMETIKYIKDRAENISKYSDKLRESIIAIDGELTPFFETAGIIVIDDEFEYMDKHGTKYQLSISKEYRGSWGIYLDNGYHEDLMFIGDAPRNALKMVVKRIIPLLEKYAKILEQNEVEYKDIAANAESMAKSIKGR